MKGNKRHANERLPSGAQGGKGSASPSASPPPQPFLPSFLPSFIIFYCFTQQSLRQVVSGQTRPWEQLPEGSA
ncbi:hypothetical protein E2C01_049432 [Portunus trituberculatus]|uniref:Uncharacterized protein n=1 Tax=Portunus trituberculatus TaxID=210409 RepID=A0A5B7GG15_PORTR|nr:hypothetical protein [Portunus trituberculatus]